MQAGTPTLTQPKTKALKIIAHATCCSSIYANEKNMTILAIIY